METSHTRRSDLLGLSAHLGPDSSVLLARSEQVTAAAVFVHGFGGHPLKAWKLFDELVLEDAQWANTDLYFISYKSITDEISLNADYVREFLRRILPSPPQELLTAPIYDRTYAARTNTGEYRRLLLVGHSEGAVVLRRAVLDLLRTELGSGLLPGDEPRSPGWLPAIRSAELRLFASAQGGARVAGLRGAIANCIGFTRMVRMFSGYSPAVQELQQGSDFLRALRDDTTLLAGQHPQVPSLRACIAWAHHDNIVSSAPYPNDRHRRFMDTDHSSVCKPRPGYMHPLDWVMNGDAADWTGVAI